MADFDLAIIGGGINGVAVARDAAGRGLRVLLVEQGDLASGTSSASSKLIHGGLRYLEHGALRLVREALAEREVLMRLAPHLVRPLRFILPAEGGSRSILALRVGLFIYDHLGGRRLLPPTRTLDLTRHDYGDPLRRAYRTGFEFSDCWVDDARLVVLTARDAADRGAAIRTRTRCVRVERGEDWTLVLMAEGQRQLATARILVNAAGPWVGHVAETVIRSTERPPVRLASGTHIIVKRIYDHDAAYVLQGPDRRVVFALPYERDYVMIGTTDDEFTGDPAMVAPTKGEIDYLCAVANAYFREVIAPADVMHAFAGVRSLYDDGAKSPSDVTRDYHVAFDQPSSAAPLITIYGGKITTHRRLAEAALAPVADYFVTGRAWTRDAPLPGGDFPHDGVDALVASALTRWTFLDRGHAQRLARSYGTRIERVLGDAKRAEDLGRHFAADLTEAELRYLVREEWARTADDALWRRSKLGLHMSPTERAEVEGFFAGASLSGEMGTRSQ